MQQSPPYDARAIANYLLDLADDRGVNLTQMSVLKIVYFAHGWYLSANDRPLCLQQFEAWEHGPVVKVVRDAFKLCKKDFIKIRAKKLIIETGEFAQVPVNILESDKEFIKNIFEAYHIYDAWQLSDFTHEAGSPWDRLWNAPVPVGRMALRIRNDEICSHFKSLKRRFAVS